MALSGTLARKQIRNVTASTEGIVSAVTSKNGSTTQAGQVMFSLNGRDAIAEAGALPFFRALAPGDQGEDVLELKQILAAAGDDPGRHGQLLHPADPVRPGPVAGPAPLSELDAGQPRVGHRLAGAGHRLQGRDPELGGPDHRPTGRADDVVRPPGSRRQRPSTRYRTEVPHDTPPGITIQSVDNQVPQGEPAVLRDHGRLGAEQCADGEPDLERTAGSNDIVTPPATATIAAGATQTTVQVQTRSNNTVEQRADDRAVGRRRERATRSDSPSSAQTTITNTNVPALTHHRAARP